MTSEQTYSKHLRYRNSEEFYPKQIGALCDDTSWHHKLELLKFESELITERG